MKVPINQVACIDLDAPTLPAERIKIRGVVRWRVWCRHCKAWHYHGPAEGHPRHIARIRPARTGGAGTISRCGGRARGCRAGIADTPWTLERLLRESRLQPRSMPCSSLLFVTGYGCVGPVNRLEVVLNDRDLAAKLDHANRLQAAQARLRQDLAS